MKELDIDFGDTEAWTFGGGNRILTVREGWTSVFLPGSDFGDIPNGSMLSGRLVFGDRVYGRITQARIGDTDRTVPVCMEMLDTSGNRGLELEPGSSAAAPRIFSTGFLKAVRSFD
jgi:serine/threonine-protein kinase